MMIGKAHRQIFSLIQENDINVSLLRWTRIGRKNPQPQTPDHALRVFASGARAPLSAMRIRSAEGLESARCPRRSR